MARLGKDLKGINEGDQATAQLLLNKINSKSAPKSAWAWGSDQRLALLRQVEESVTKGESAAAGCGKVGYRDARRPSAGGSV